MKIYICSHCPYKAMDESNMLEHQSKFHPDDHPQWEELEADLSGYEEIEVLPSEWTDKTPLESKPKGQEPIVPPNSPKEWSSKYPAQQLAKNEYPYPPFYKLDDKYLCLNCELETDANGMYRHMFQSHKANFEAWTKHYLRQKAIEKFRAHSKTEALDDVTLSRWIEDDFNRLMLDSELTEDASGENLGKWFRDRNIEILTFLENKQDHCPICGLQKQVALMPTDQELYIQKRILDCLTKNNDALKGIQSFQELSGYTSDGFWNLTPVKLDLLCNLHMSIRRKENYRGLVHDGILKGQVPSFLVDWNAEPSNEKLTSSALLVHEAGIKGLSKNLADYRTWLLQKRKH